MPTPLPTRARRVRPWLAPMLAGMVALPSLFLGGMYSGEMLKAKLTSRVIEDAPAGAVSEDQFKLELGVDARLALIDPARVRLELARGWDREQTAFNDGTALIYFSGPFFEEHHGSDYYAHAIGDLYFDDHLEVATQVSRGFADRRYYMALTRNGRVEFGFGGWQAGMEQRYCAFVGGMGYLFNQDGEAPNYINPYSGIKQELHNMIPRERLIVGRTADGKLAVIKTLPMLVGSATWLARDHELVEAYFLDQGNKARFIVPGKVDDAPRYNLPYLLRISDNNSPPLEYSPPPLEEYQLHNKKRRKTRAAAPQASPSPSVAPVDPFGAAAPEITPEPLPDDTPEPEIDPFGSPAPDPTPNSETP